MIYLTLPWYLVVLWLAFLPLEQSEPFIKPPSPVKQSNFGCSGCEWSSICQSFLHGLCANSPRNGLSGTEYPLEEQSYQSKDLEGQKLRAKCISSDLSLGDEKGKRGYVSFQHSHSVTRPIDGDGSWVPKLGSVHWRLGSSFIEQARLGESLTVGRKYRSCLQGLANVHLMQLWIKGLGRLRGGRVLCCLSVTWCSCGEVWAMVPGDLSRRLCSEGGQQKCLLWGTAESPWTWDSLSQILSKVSEWSCQVTSQAELLR